MTAGLTTTCSTDLCPSTWRICARCRSSSTSAVSFSTRSQSMPLSLKRLRPILPGFPSRPSERSSAELSSAEMLKFITEYKVKDLDVGHGAALPEAVLKQIVSMKLTSFGYTFDVPADFISSMTFPYLYLQFVSIDTAKAIIQKALSFPEFEEWNFRLDVDEAGFGALFANHELLDFDHSGPLPERRPLVFVKRDEQDDEDVGVYCLNLYFYCLRADGKMIIFEKTWGLDEETANFRMRGCEEGPPALQALIDPK